jgi:hypothetical protein
MELDSLAKVITFRDHVWSIRRLVENMPTFGQMLSRADTCAPPEDAAVIAHATKAIKNVTLHNARKLHLNFHAQT